MLAKCIKSFHRNSVDCLLADQRFDILYIAVFRVLGTGACPKQTLGMSALFR